MQFICASIGTILSFARPYSPESRGKIERWFRTLQTQWMNVINWNDFSSLEELNKSLYKYVEENYNSKVHSSINEKPIDKFIRHIDIIRFIPTKLSIIFLLGLPVLLKGFYYINTISFLSALKYVGESISIRYDPTNMDKAFIFSNDNLLLDTIYPIKKIDNSKIRRANNFKVVDFSSFNPNNNERGSDLYV